MSSTISQPSRTSRTSSPASPVAVVTGASSGIGQALLPLLAADRNDLVLVARRKDRLEEQQRDLERRYGIRVHALPLDLAAPGATDEVMGFLEARRLAVDVLVNNAGFALYGELADQPLAKAREMIALNVMALTELTHHAITQMRARGRGKILQVASTAAFQPGPRMAVYYATKAYVLSFSEALSAELEGSGVTVTTLCPGPTKSEFMEVARYAVTPLVEKAMMSSEEVARVGYRAMMRGDRLAIAGTKNKVLAAASQLGPRSMVLAVTDRLMRARE